MLDVGVLLLSSCCLVIAWYIDGFLFTLPSTTPHHHTHTHHHHHKHVIYRLLHCCLWPLLSLRGSPQCIAFKRNCTCQHLTAVQHNVCPAKRCFCTTRSLAISANDFFAAAFECLLVRHHEEKRKNYELQTVTVLLLLLLLVLLLFKYFRDRSASVNADSQLHL